MQYEFDAETEIEKIQRGWIEWAHTTKCMKFVLGISGGKDSTFLAWLGAKTFGPDNICGVMMPNGVQSDINDSKRVIDLTGISSMTVNIATAFDGISSQIPNFSQQARENLPPRIRMATLFAVAQTFGGMVLCTDNLSERIAGYFTLGGDGFGCYDPIRDYTATEVVQMGEKLGVPYDLIHKKPGDGLQALGDEERLGFTYAQLDALIREDAGTDEFKQKIRERYLKNKFKTDIVDIPGPMSGLPNFITKGDN